MTWNYRIIRHKPNPGTEESFGIHEVYYDKSSKPYAVTKYAVGVTGDTIEELHENYKMFAEAFRAPAIDYDNIPQVDEEIHEDEEETGEIT